MKKIILKIISITIIAWHLTTTAYAETAVTTQDINITVPVISLLDVENITPSFIFNPPNNAGDGFSISSIDNQANVAVSTNNLNTKLLARVDQNLSSHGLGLSLSATNLGACHTGILLNTTNQTLCNIGSIQTNTGELTINIDNSIGNGISAHGNYTVEITYTLTND